MTGTRRYARLLNLSTLHMQGNQTPEPGAMFSLWPIGSRLLNSLQQIQWNFIPLSLPDETSAPHSGVFVDYHLK